MNPSFVRAQRAAPTSRYISGAARCALTILLVVLWLLMSIAMGLAEPVQPRDLAMLRTEFSQLDIARQKEKPSTKERAEAALKASQLASDIGWQLFEKGESTQAADWFARRAALKKESYEHARRYWEEYLTGEVTNRENQLAARAQEWDAKRKNEADPKKREELQAAVGALVKMRLVERYAVISQLQTLARDNDAASTLLKYNEQELELKRTELADLQKLNAPAKEIAVKQSEIAKALERVASAQSDVALFSQAENNFQAALSIRRALPDDLPERQLHETLLAMGSMYLHDVGDYRKAREYYAGALQEFEASASLRAKAAAAEKTDDNKDLARALTTITEANIVANLGAALQEGGDYFGARQYFDRALQSAESLPDGSAMNIFTWARAVLRARAFSELAGLNAAIGETEKAKAQLDAVVQLKRALGNDESTATTLQQAADFHYSQSDLTTAKRYVEQSRLIFQQAQRLPNIVTATSFLATIARDENKLDEAAKYAEEALPLARQSGNVSLAAGVLRTLASIRLEQKRVQEASTLLDEAARIDERTNSTLDKIATLGLQGRVLEAQNQNDKALEKYTNAVSLLENIRATSGSALFGENKNTAKAYERLVLLLLKMDRGEEAFDWMQRARSKQVQESLRLTSLKTSNKDLQALLDRASTLESKLQTVRGQLQSEQAKPAAQQDVKKIENLQTLVASTQGEYRRVLEQIKRSHPDKKIFNVDPKQIKETQSSIPADTALIQYAPLEDQFYILVVTRESLKVFTTPTNPDELWKRIKAVRTQIVRPAQNRMETRGVSLATPENEATQDSLRENLSALYRMLIAPIEEEVKSKSTLAFIPSQLLYYLPLHALSKENNGKLEYLVESKKVVFLSATDLMRFVQQTQEKNPAGMIAFGDPTGANLPAARDEVATIAKIFPAAQTLIGDDATKKAALAPDALDKRVVHFATHGILNQSEPSLSYIQLSKPTPEIEPEKFQLTVGEVWDLPLRGVDLVTLSACETALAENAPAPGNDITTLAEAFSDAGAQTVIATLWSVADESTRVWMVEFYSELAAGKAKGEAFHAAQLKLLQSKEYSHPYYWAPFIMMGDWR